MANIYLSATYKDLKAHRDAVYRILRMLRHDVVSMEDYVATDAYPLHKCLSDVAKCDTYVGLIGWRYGYIPEQDNPDGKSITELEYRQAGDSGKPRLLFLADSAAAWPDEFKDAHTGEGEAGAHITAFRNELEAVKLVSHFRSPDHLAGLVSVAVTRCLAENPPPRPKVKEIKCRGLEKRLDALLETYQAATAQLAWTLSAVDEVKIKRQIAAIETEISQVEAELAGLEHGD
jgi:hypothetical protein